MRYPLIQDLLLGDVVNGWHLRPLERRMVHALLVRRLPLSDLVQDVYAREDGGPEYATSAVKVKLHDLRKDFPAAFPRQTGRPMADEPIAFKPDVLEAIVAKPGARSTMRPRNRAVTERQTSPAAKREMSRRFHRRRDEQAKQAILLRLHLENALAVAETLRNRRIANHLAAA